MWTKKWRGRTEEGNGQNDNTSSVESETDLRLTVAFEVSSLTFVIALHYLSTALDSYDLFVPVLLYMRYPPPHVALSASSSPSQYWAAGFGCQA